MYPAVDIYSSQVLPDYSSRGGRKNQQATAFTPLLSFVLHKNLIKCEILNREFPSGSASGGHVRLLASSPGFSYVNVRGSQRSNDPVFHTQKVKIREKIKAGT